MCFRPSWAIVQYGKWKAEAFLKKKKIRCISEIVSYIFRVIICRPHRSRLTSPSSCSGPVAQDLNSASCCSFIATWDMGAGPEFCWLPPKSQNVLEQIPAAEVNTGQSGFIYLCLRLHESKKNKPSSPALFLKHHSLFVHCCHSSCHLNDRRLREGEETALSWACFLLFFFFATATVNLLCLIAFRTVFGFDI